MPFDDSSFSGLLVSQKEFSAAYAPQRARPPMESLRLETGRTVGHVIDAPSFPERVSRMTSSFLTAFEKLLMAWTPVLLMTTIPLPGWWSLTSAGGWITILWGFYCFSSRLSASLRVWPSDILVTLTWICDTPFMASFFLA